MTDVQCDIFFGLFTWKLACPRMHGCFHDCITLASGGRAVSGKHYMQLATYFNNTEAEKHRNLWPENSFAGQRTLFTEHNLALPACVPSGLPRITKQIYSRSFTVCLDGLMNLSKARTPLQAACTMECNSLERKISTLKFASTHQTWTKGCPF